MAAPERQDRSVDSVEWAAVDDREKIVRFPTRSEPVLSLNDGFGGKPEPAGLRHRLPLRVDSGHPNLNGGINALSANLAISVPESRPIDGQWIVGARL